MRPHESKNSISGFSSKNYSIRINATPEKRALKKSDAPTRPSELSPNLSRRINSALILDTNIRNRWKFTNPSTHSNPDRDSSLCGSTTFILNQLDKTQDQNISNPKILATTPRQHVSSFQVAPRNHSISKTQSM